MFQSKASNNSLSYFYKSIFTMFKGVAIAQLFAMISSIFFAKIYGEKAYGFLAIYISFLNILAIINTLQLEYFIISSKKNGTNWFNFIIRVIPVLSFIFILIAVLSSLSIPKDFNIKILILSIIGSSLLSLYTINENLFVIKKQIKLIANIKISLTILTILIQFFSFYFFKNLGLIIGNILAIFVIVIFYFVKSNSYCKAPNLKLIKLELSLNKGIIKYLLPSNVVNSLSLHSMSILLLYFFGAKQTGEYFLSLKILSAPLFIISKSISKVYFQKASEIIKLSSKELLKMTKKIVIIVFCIISLFLIVINTIGINILEYFFDKDWQNLRLFIAILSFLILGKSLVNPISSISILLNKNHVILLFNVYLFIINLIAIYAGVFTNNIIYTISILAILGGLGYLFLVYYFFNNLKNI